MRDLIFQFGKQLYVAENPPSTWRQVNEEAPIHCMRCDDDIVWVFPARLDRVKAGQGCGYEHPVATRCQCHLKIPGSSYSGELLESPVKIHPVQTKEEL
jgi:hypothetical protein